MTANLTFHWGCRLQPLAKNPQNASDRRESDTLFDRLAGKRGTP
jgi:hypothetical protein